MPASVWCATTIAMSAMSTKFDSAGMPNMGETMQKAMRGQPIDARLHADRHGDDAIGLLDALGISEGAYRRRVDGRHDRAGSSPPKHPDRTASLVSIMSSSGRPGLPPAKPEAMMALTAPPPATDRDSVIAHTMKARRIIGSPGYPEDEAVLRQQVADSYDRSYYPQGMARQFAAIVADGSRVERLGKDPRAVAGDPRRRRSAGAGRSRQGHRREHPGASCCLVPGMGHGIESGVEPIVADAIIDFCRKAVG